MLGEEAMFANNPPDVDSSCTCQVCAPVDARGCKIRLYGRELERERARRAQQPGEGLPLRAFDIELDEIRISVPGDQCIERDCLDLNALRPFFSVPARSARARGDEGI